MRDDKTVGITSKRAAEVLSMAVSFNGCGRTTSDELKEAVRAAIHALEEKERLSNPLSMADLRYMDKQIVYCLELNMEVRVAAARTGWVTIHYPLQSENYCEKAHGLTLYRTNKGVRY